MKDITVTPHGLEAIRRHAVGKTLPVVPHPKGRGLMRVRLTDAQYAEVLKVTDHENGVSESDAVDKLFGA